MQLQSPSSVKKNPKLGPYEMMRPFPKWVRPSAMAVEEVSSGEGDVEMEVPSGSSAAREVPKAPQPLSGTGTEGITDAEMAELRIIMEEAWSPLFEAPPAVFPLQPGHRWQSGRQCKIMSVVACEKYLC